MPTVRSFIAIELPEAVKMALEQIEGQLRSKFPSTAVKWVAPEGIHITLQFLGPVDEQKIDPITVAIAGAATGVLPFRLEVKGLGAFPNLDRVNVVWAGVAGDLDCLCSLQKRIEENLKPLGFTPEARQFSPHLTLARVRVQASPEQRQAFGKLIAETPFQPGVAFDVNAVHLVRSQLTRQGAVYSALSAVRLG